jgi:hypothetical protein
MGRIFLYILAGAYPVLVFVFLVIFKIPVRFFSLFVVSAALVYFLGAGTKKKIPSPDCKRLSPGRSGNRVSYHEFPAGSETIPGSGERRDVMRFWGHAFFSSGYGVPFCPASGQINTGLPCRKTGGKVLPESDARLVRLFYPERRYGPVYRVFCVGKAVVCI